MDETEAEFKADQGVWEEFEEDKKSKRHYPRNIVF